MATSVSAIAEEQTSGKELPVKWAETFRRKFRSSISHTFLLTGNVRDVVNNQMTLETYLARVFLSPRPGNRQMFDMVMFYDRASGLTFAMPEMRAKFLDICGLTEAAKGAGATSGIFGQMAGDPVAIPKAPKQVFELVEKVLKAERPMEDAPKNSNLKWHAAFIVGYAESLMPGGTWSQLGEEDRYCIVKMLNWAKDKQIRANGNPIMLVADSAVQMHDTLTSSASRIEMIELLLPTPEERLSYVEYINRCEVEKNKTPLKFAPKFDMKRMANLTAGLKRLNIEDIKLTAEQTGEPISQEMVKQRKKEIYESEYQAVLEIVEPSFGWEGIGGYEWLKEYFDVDVIDAMLTGDYARVPQGVLGVGPPGTGKSAFFEALAKMAGMNMLKLDIGKVLGSLIGESEHKMAKALLAIKSLVPVLVFIDEIDQAVNRGSHGDSGVSDRIFKMLLQFMADTTLRGKVLFVGATNRPDMMDAALKRRGRFDKVIPFLQPDASQRAKIFPSLLNRFGHKVDTANLDYEELALATENWNGSDIEAGIVKSYQLARRANSPVIKQEHLKEALDLVIPATQDVELWGLLALRETSDKELLPPNVRSSFKKASIEKEIRKLRRESNTYAMEEHQRTVRNDVL